MCSLGILLPYLVIFNISWKGCEILGRKGTLFRVSINIISFPHTTNDISLCNYFLGNQQSSPNIIFLNLISKQISLNEATKMNQIKCWQLRRNFIYPIQIALDMWQLITVPINIAHNRQAIKVYEYWIYLY